jgi:hypothetical protein
MGLTMDTNYKEVLERAVEGFLSSWKGPSEYLETVVGFFPDGSKDLWVADVQHPIEEVALLSVTKTVFRLNPFVASLFTMPVYSFEDKIPDEPDITQWPGYREGAAFYLETPGFFEVRIYPALYQNGKSKFQDPLVSNKRIPTDPRQGLLKENQLKEPEKFPPLMQPLRAIMSRVPNQQGVSDYPINLGPYQQSVIASNHPEHKLYEELIRRFKKEGEQ